ncbi:aldose 1-epimerase family protein [Paratractidigestivibacter sp.]|uniref:aldose 1-epimerase family protein n=1 Tax=Paratractidigestivibacter sp. TaxID=2847316 RepID=UPI002ABE958A|nr:aldose 1-epimerase family protein [Paratractidigestivibacter sp.]
MTCTTICAKGLSATIDSMGAQLMSLKVGDAEYLWQGDPEFWARRAPVLFPIVGCLRGDESVSERGPVHLKRHGIARLYDHRLVDSGESSVTYELTSNNETRAAFPFDFKLNMTYSVDGTSLAQAFKVTNTGDVDLPFTLGGHPAFNVPVPGAEGETFDDYKLVFPEAWTARIPAIDEAGIHDFGNMTTLFEDQREFDLSHELIAEHLTIVLCDVPGNRVSLVGKKSGHGVELEFPGFDYFGVWSASETAPFVALEPWHGCASAYDEPEAFEAKRSTMVLAPGESTELAFTVTPF